MIVWGCEVSTLTDWHYMHDLCSLKSLISLFIQTGLSVVSESLMCWGLKWGRHNLFPWEIYNPEWKKKVNMTSSKKEKREKILCIGEICMVKLPRSKLEGPMYSS